MAQQTFGEQVRHHRESLGLTRKQLASKVGCAAVTLYKIETNERRPSHQMAQLLALHLNLPAAQTRAFVQMARGGGRLSNVPVALTPLIGRDEDMQRITTSLQRTEVRLLTLTGSPGVGKTQLAMAVAHTMASQAAFGDGVCVVQLSALKDSQQVLSAIAQALNIAESNDATLWGKTLHALHSQQLLLVLDNFEHVLPAAPRLVDLLQACPHLKALVTSQAALRVGGEYEYAVAPLRWSTDSANSANQALAPAVDLFAQRAQAVWAAFSLTPHNIQTVTEICRHLDGLPLAIELAAARIKMFSPAALLAQLSQRQRQRFALLAGGPTNAPTRHRTLWRAIDWSYHLLAPDVQRALHCTALFAGSFALESFMAVAECAAQQALTLITALVHHSLIVPMPDAAPSSRFRLLESVREYAYGQLIQTPEYRALCRRHAEHFAAQAGGPAVWRDDVDNLRCALHFWVNSREFEPAACMLNALAPVWVRWGLLGEGSNWFDAVLSLGPFDTAHAPTQTLLANTLDNAAMPAMLRGALSDAQRYLETALRLWQQMGHAHNLAQTRGNLGVIAMVAGHYDEAVLKLEQALAHWLQAGSSHQAAVILYNLGVIAGWQGATVHMAQRFTEAFEMYQSLNNRNGAAQVLALHAYFLVAAGELPRAEALCAQSLALSRRLNDEFQIAVGTGVSARIALTKGKTEEARILFADALRVFSEQGRQEFGLYCLEGLAHIAAITQQPERAAHLLAAVSGIRLRTGIAEPASERERNRSALNQAQGMLESEVYERICAEGSGMSFDQTAAYALATPQPPRQC
jgi:predicted ATPase/DNA-binding XRE family transcriptional regulator